jgi:hypothetical protein
VTEIGVTRDASRFNNFTFAQPLQKCAVLPKLLENVPDTAPPDLPDALAYIDFRADKSFFLSTFSQKEEQQQQHEKTGGTTSLAKLIETSGERNFFELSHHVIPAHKEFVARFCQRNRENSIAALEQMDHFLDDNTQFSCADAVVSDVVKALEEMLKSRE